MRPLPEPLNTLINGDNARSRLFRLSLRRWNELFAFTSIKFNMDKRMAEFGNSFQLFQIHGAMYHRQGLLVPGGGQDALYSQIYLYDPAYAAQERSRRAPELDPEIVHSLTLMLQQSNPMIQIYLTAKERLADIAQAEDNFRLILNPQLQLVVERGADMRRENLPTTDEVSMILPEEYGSAGFRDIVLAKRINGDDDDSNPLRSSIPTTPPTFPSTMFSYSHIVSRDGTGEGPLTIVKGTSRTRTYPSGHFTGSVCTRDPMSL